MVAFHNIIILSPAFRSVALEVIVCCLEPHSSSMVNTVWSLRMKHTPSSENRSHSHRHRIEVRLRLESKRNQRRCSKGCSLFASIHCFAHRKTTIERAWQKERERTNLTIHLTVSRKYVTFSRSFLFALSLSHHNHRHALYCLAIRQPMVKSDSPSLPLSLFAQEETKSDDGVLCLSDTPDWQLKQIEGRFMRLAKPKLREGKQAPSACSIGWWYIRGSEGNWCSMLNGMVTYVPRWLGWGSIELSISLASRTTFTLYFDQQFITMVIFIPEHTPYRVDMQANCHAKHPTWEASVEKTRVRTTRYDVCLLTHYPCLIGSNHNCANMLLDEDTRLSSSAWIRCILFFVRSCTQQSMPLIWCVIRIAYRNWNFGGSQRSFIEWRTWVGTTEETLNQENSKEAQSNN